MDFLVECFEQTSLKLENYTIFLNNFKSEYPKLVSNPTTINSLGWYPKTDFKKLVKILL
jgi:GDPmannose 4,6-dehydratase